jgi:glucokinase
MTVQSNTNSEYVLGYDVGGSHVSAGFCRLQDLRAGRLAQAPLPAELTAAGFIELLHSLCVEAAGGPGNVAGASLAMPGPFDYVAGISQMRHKLVSLFGVDLRKAIAERFGWEPSQICFLNDAQSYLLGEVGAGAALGAARAVGITLGTGIGSAFAVDSSIVTDGVGVPPGGEIWDYPYGGGTVEDLLSTRALQKDYFERTGHHEEVVTIAAAAAGDAEALAAFETFGRRLGEVFRDILAPFSPDVVVIGGGIARSSRLFLPVAEQRIQGLGFKLVTSSLMDQAPLIGAAFHWRETRGTRTAGS